MPMTATSGDDLLMRASVTPPELSRMTSETIGRPVDHALACATPFPYSWGSPATAGLWRVDVRDSTDSAHVMYRYFVKLLRHTRLWPALRYLPDDASRAEFVDLFPWRAELEMYECGIGSVLPPGMRTPVLHHVRYADADHIALWLEYIAQRSAPWQSADYRLAATLLGRLAARRRAGAEVNRALPEISRVRPSGGSSLRYFTERRVLRSALPMLREGHFWEHPVVAAALRRAADPGLPADLLALGASLPAILDMLDELPQTHAHGDASPQNLLLPEDEPARSSSSTGDSGACCRSASISVSC